MNSTLESTYKARDVEGLLDLFFYRKLGFQLARFCAVLKLTPVTVTVLGGVCGMFAGHLYFYRDLRTNILGMLLHVFANLLDNVDGQLARLLNQKSRTGRVIDSIFDHLIFLSIYVHLSLRCWFEGGSLPVIALLAIAAGLSHGLQGAAADYFRNAYLFFVKGRARADWDSTRTLKQEYRHLRWDRDPWQKFMLALYIQFTWQQELLSPRLRRLRDLSEHAFPNDVPDQLRQHYRQNARPMLRGWGLLMTNTRMFFLFLVLILDRPAWFFWMEISVLNLLLAFLIVRQELMAESLVEDIDQAKPVAS
ncbi:MAG TPA: CDP-alcohol phosphatidyltransferase family protein [Chthoniobacterales bacterium]|nr:CDP-alcohol phosphatidyltransferase family protein [Chthoniobacterales bacterium]